MALFRFFVVVDNAVKIIVLLKAKYHEDFEKSKGTYTVVADDPETRRILENTKNISQVSKLKDFNFNFGILSHL